MSTNLPGTQPNPNRPLTISEVARQTLCLYPLTQIRKDMSIQEKILYNYEWNLFNQVWAYNYTASTLNGLSGTRDNSPWQQLNNKDRVSYRRGQIWHVTAYPSSATVFNNIVF
jgi:hypothetical protein